MSDINLLPEDIRKEEEKYKASPGKKPEVSFHVPSNNKPPKPAEPKEDVVDMFEEKISKEDDIKKPPAVPKAPAPPKKILSEITRRDEKKPADFKKKPSSVKKESFLKKLFGKKKGNGRILENKMDEESKKIVGGQGFDVNLIPEGSYLLPNKRLALYFIVSFSLGLLLLSLTMFVLTVIKQSTIKEQDLLIDMLNESEEKYKLLKVKEDEAVVWSKKVDLVKNLLSKHIYWSNFFGELERMTLPEVYYSNIQVSIDGVVTISATTDSYNSIARQYSAYQTNGDALDQISITGISGDSLLGIVNFNVVMDLNDNIYYSYQNNN